MKEVYSALKRQLNYTQYSTHLFASKRLVDAEVLAVEYGEREVHVNAHRLGSTLPHQVGA